MKHQWRPGIGGFVDLNCGWYCQDALLGWYCNKHNLPETLLKQGAKRNRLGYGFSPEDSFCYSISIPRDVECYKQVLLKHGPIIASGKLGMADFGVLGGVNHYILILSVDTKCKKITIQDPLNINFGRPGYSDYSICDFYKVAGRIEDTLIINQYKINHFRG
ncbi:kinesin [Escherichia coli]|nr:kinesin [Escherichia coli]EMB0462767.1 kinesin [Escherichia coli]